VQVLDVFINAQGFVQVTVHLFMFYVVFHMFLNL
jgi:hypothetical protein